ncbi:PP2C family protein-serine/threonine phosphatase [Flexilinea flocculi]|jgi:serine/threonine protein phosphatase PrpC|uniref:Serine/threonine protein phosphatase PrpC n=1 Tax=Flexilinea flocculi TaxID=1678840 RepID=A0A0S7BVB2_9CHLR|nr:protein phosphatase 2C domain-containing protein [Flexilinea flocculi]GAP40504.1 serine/threonine protein phosphatase PrpC [Flexilinea flocculi]
MMKKKPTYSLFSANAHSIGKVRPTNEDALFSFESEIFRMNQKATIGLYIIADGMGGHISGDRASAAAINTFVAYYFESVYPLLIADNELKKSISEYLTEGIIQANKSVKKEVPGGGTTFTVAQVWNHKVYFAHVGDSRIYHFDKKFHSRRLTNDHSLVSMLVELGEINQEEALTHPRRSVLLRSLGFNLDVEIDTGELEFEAGEFLLLCCDGLWSVVPESEMITILQKKAGLQEIVGEFVNSANDHGGPDNISCILVQMS